MENNNIGWNADRAALYEMLTSLLEGEEDIWKAKSKEFMENILKLLVYKRDFEALKLDFSILADYLTLDKLASEAIKYRSICYKNGELNDFVRYLSSTVNIDMKRFIIADEAALDKEVRETIRKGQDGSQGVYDIHVALAYWRNAISQKFYRVDCMAKKPKRNGNAL